MITLNIPTEEDRIASLYGEQIKQYSEAINQAILTGAWECGRFDYLRVHVNNGEYIHSEITAWLKKQYMQAGWLIEANSFDEQYHYRLFRTQPTKHSSSRMQENAGEDIPE